MVWGERARGDDDIVYRMMFYRDPMGNRGRIEENELFSQPIARIVFGQVISLMTDSFVWICIC